MTLTDRITDMLLQHARLLMIGFVLLVVVLAAGVPKVQISGDNRAFFDQTNVEYRDVLAMDATYTVSDPLLLMVVPPAGQAFAPESLGILREMTADAWQTPYALRVDSAINHTHTYADGDEVLVEPLLDEFAEITPQVAARFGKLALASDALRNRLLAADGSAYGISIQVVLPEEGHGAHKEVETAIHAMRSTWADAYPGWQIHAAGSLLGNNLLGRVALEDIIRLVPLALLAVIALLVVALGSLVAVGVTILVLSTATLATFGFVGWTGVALTAGTAISPLAVMVLVSTSCIHIILSTVRAFETGKVADPFRHAIRNNLAPVTVSHLTTAFGFLCLNFAPSPPLAEMGNIVAFGLAVGHLAVFILLPGLLARHNITRTGRFMVTGAMMRRLAGWVLRHSRVWLVLFPVACGIAILGIFRIDYDDNVIRYFDERYELRQDAEAIGAQLTGLDTLKFSFRAPDGTSIFEPDFLAAVDRFALWLESQPDVIAVDGLPRIIKDINQSMSGDDSTAFAIADSQPANAQLLMFYELSLPVGMDLNVMMDVDRTQTLLTATVHADHSATMRRLAAQADAWLAQNEPQIATRAAGLGIAFARITERNNAQMIYGFLTVLGLVSLTLVITLRSLLHGAISLIPNLVPAILAFGLWGWTIGDVNLGSTVVTTMTFGIVVDDTVHFLMHFLRGRRAGLSTETALEETFAVVGSSITLTSVALITGFAIMTVSGFSINQHIGLLTAVVVGFALLSDLLFLPAMLKTFQGNQK